MRGILAENSYNEGLANNQTRPDMLAIDPMNPINASDPQLHAVVKASAGVGKTYLLVTRLVRLLMNDVNPGSILAITFTRKAASEIHSRLIARLRNFVTQNDATLSKNLADIGIEANSDTLDKARNLYEQLLRSDTQVKASTFHAFCQDILRKFPLEADVPAGFELLEQEAGLRTAAWEALYSHTTLNPESDLARALEILFNHGGGLHNTQLALNAFISARSDWWAYTSIVTNPVLFASDKLQQVLQVTEDALPHQQFFENTLPAIRAFTQLLGKIANNNTLLEQYNTSYNAIEIAESASHDNARYNIAFTEFFYTLFTKAHEPRALRKLSKEQQKRITPEEEQTLIALRENIVQAITDTRETLNRQMNLKLGKAWYLAGSALLDHFQRIKDEQRVLDFTDLEWKAYELLNHSNNALWIQYKLDQQIKHLLIDEFQDTNPTQWRLLYPLMQEFASDPEQARSIFIVGDAKQSIYSFRRAEPQLLNYAEEWLQDALGAQSYPMDKSRRSAKAIMSVVNNTFSHPALKTRIGDFHAHTTHHQTLFGHAELLPLITKNNDADSPEYMRNPLQSPRAQSDKDSYYREGQLIAQRIQHLIQSKTPVTHTKTHAMRYADIMILVRTRSHVKQYEQALREQHIPYISADRGTLLECEEIQDIVALLDFIRSPFGNLSLATVLKSPVFSLSDEDLVQLALHQKHNSWYETLAMLATNTECSDALKHAYHKLTHWHVLAGQLPTHDLLDCIMNEADLVTRYVQAFPSHLHKRLHSNFSRLLELALEVDSGRYPSIARFLNRLQALRESEQEAPDEGTPADIDNAVRIMTIHASKGLEAPVLFLADAAGSGSNKRSYQPIIDWPPADEKPNAFMLLLKQAHRDNIIEALVTSQQTREQKEDANLLYVALTRARQYLFISGCAPARGEKTGWYGLIQDQWPRCENSESEFPYAPIVSETPEFCLEAAVASNDASLPATLDAALKKPFIHSTTVADIAPSETTKEALAEHEDPLASERGTIIHRLLQLLSTDKSLDDAIVIQQLQFELGKSPADDFWQACLQEAKTVITHHATRDFFDPTQYHTAYNELTINYQSGKQLVHGVIDRVLVSEKNITIIDYKTNQHVSPESAAKIAAQYATQLDYYAKAVSQIWPHRKINQVVLFTKLPCAVSPVIT